MSMEVEDIANRVLELEALVAARKKRWVILVGVVLASELMILAALFVFC